MILYNIYSLYKNRNESAKTPKDILIRGARVHNLKNILNGSRLIICQSNGKNVDLRKNYHEAEINPIGEWTGGPDVDTGATNKKLGSDMADFVTGGGLHGKDLSKADVSVNIYAF